LELYVNENIFWAVIYQHRVHFLELTLNPLTWKIWWAPNNASRWQMGFNSAFKGLKYEKRKYQPILFTKKHNLMPRFIV